jgi:Fe-S cluster assembly protein SufD
LIVTSPATIGAEEAAWMAALRADALERLPNTPMPSEREEVWRYLDLGFDPAFETAPSSPGSAGGSDPLREAWSGAVIDVVDGFVLGDVPTVSTATEPVSMATGADLFSVAFDAMTPGALLLDGRLLTEPVLVDVQATSDSTTFPGVHIVVETGTDASVVVRMRSVTDVGSVVVPRLTADVGDNARLALTVIQDWNYKTRSLGRAVIDVGRDSGLILSEIGLGALLGRLHLDVNYKGDGSWGKIYGAYFGEQDQTLDYRYFMNHIGTNTRADMFLKGAVEDQADSVFTGLIRIEETGSRTESFQTNRNLILSDGASAQSVPNLEILNNDVKCGHGSSVGPLDEDQKYYLMSRGLTSDVADRLQVKGFFAEALAEMPQAELEPYLRERILAKYLVAQEEGRV